MPDAASNTHARGVSRRGLLASGAIGTLGLLTSCSRMLPGGAASGAGTPGPSLGAGEAPLTPYADLAAQLRDAAAEFSAVVATPAVPHATASWAAAASAMCREQSRHLQLPDPLAAPPASTAFTASPGGASSSTPSPLPTGTLVAHLASIAGRQRSLEAQFRSRCLAADAGDLALLLASLAVTAHAVRGPATPVVPSGPAPAHVDVGSPNEALSVLLSRLEALAQGLEVGVGALPSTDRDTGTGEARQAQVWALRDRIESRLAEASATPTPGPLVYDLPGTTGSPAAVRALWGRLESDVMAAWLRVAASSTGAERAEAVDAATAQQDRVASLATPVTWWPGWV